MGSFTLGPRHTTVLEFRIGKSKQAGGSPPFPLGCGVARKAKDHIARYAAIVNSFAFVKGFCEGGVRRPEVPPAQVNPAEVPHRFGLRCAELAEDRLSLLEMIKLCFLVVVSEERVGEVVVRPGSVYAVAGTAGDGQGFLVDGFACQEIVGGQPIGDKTFSKQHRVACGPGEIYGGLACHVPRFAVTGGVVHEGEPPQRSRDVEVVVGAPGDVEGLHEV